MSESLGKSDLTESPFLLFKCNETLEAVSLQLLFQHVVVLFPCSATRISSSAETYAESNSTVRFQLTNQEIKPARV